MCEIYGTEKQNFSICITVLVVCNISLLALYNRSFSPKMNATKGQSMCERHSYQLGHALHICDAVDVSKLCSSWVGRPLLNTGSSDEAQNDKNGNGMEMRPN